MFFPGHQVVNLKEVELWNSPVPARLLCLLLAGRRAGYPDFVCCEERLRVRELAEAVTDDFLRRAVHWGGIDEAPSLFEERPHHLRAGIARGYVIADIERDPAA